MFQYDGVRVEAIQLQPTVAAAAVNVGQINPPIHLQKPDLIRVQLLVGLP
jgi:hypothetical protein